jgi:hypothetical protein
MSASPANDALQMMLSEFGQTVTHRKRDGSTFEIRGVFSQAPLTALTDNREGRTNANTGNLMTGTTDVDGTTITIDDQGEFAIADDRWAITNIGPLDGGWTLILKKTDRKTIRHMPGNS